VLNVVVGLIFIFLIYSLLATALQEALASILQSRANTLYKGIKSMLTNTNLNQSIITKIGNYLKRKFVNIWLWLKSLFVDQEVNALYDRFYHHPIIKNYGENSVFSKPSYLTAENFSTVLVDTIKNLEPDNETKTATFQMIYDTVVKHSDMTAVMAAAFPDRKGATSPTIDCETFKILNFHLNEAAGDLGVFKTRLEQWFNDTMGRVSGWYKRHTQTWLLIIGFVLAMLLDINAIQITSTLSKNKVVAQKIAEMGVAASKNQAYKDTVITNTFLKEINAQKDSVNVLVGAGWTYTPNMTAWQKVKTALEGTFETAWSNFFGILITALAISLGAPFWFDLLTRFVNLRAAGSTVKSSGSSTNKAPGK
jgi:hypothetical protein